MRRVALFIGVDEYQDSMINNLNCAVSDALTTAGIFRKRGFTTYQLTNQEANKNIVAAKVNEICKTLENGDMFVFYFAGHGNETNDAHSLIFSSANTASLDLTNGEDSIPLSVIRQNCETGCKNGIYKLFILDCCRNDILRGSRGGRERFLARNISLTGTDRNDGVRPPLILRSCQSGQCAYEDEEAKHGFFTQAMIEALSDETISDFSSFLQKMNSVMERKIHPNRQRITVGEYDGRNIPLFDGWNPQTTGTPHREFPVYMPQISATAQKFIDNISALKSEGLIFVKGNRTLMKCSSRVESCIIPEGVTEIYSNAFARCSKLLFAALPDSLTKIGHYAFSGCSALEVIRIPENVSELGNMAFNECGSLKEITLPQSITKLNTKTFYKCIALEDIVIPPGITEIGIETFGNCSALQEIIIPDSVKNLCSMAFAGCSALKKVILPKGLTNLENSVFQNCNNLREVIAGKDTVIPEDALPVLCKVTRI